MLDSVVWRGTGGHWPDLGPAVHSLSLASKKASSHLPGMVWRLADRSLRRVQEHTHTLEIYVKRIKTTRSVHKKLCILCSVARGHRRSSIVLHLVIEPHLQIRFKILFYD